MQHMRRCRDTVAGEKAVRFAPEAPPGGSGLTANSRGSRTLFRVPLAGVEAAGAACRTFDRGPVRRLWCSLASWLLCSMRNCRGHAPRTATSQNCCGN